MKGKHLKNKQTFFSEWSLYKLFIFLCLMCFKRGKPRRGLCSAQWLQPPNVQFCCIVGPAYYLRFCFLAVHPESRWKLSSATFILGKCIYQKDTVCFQQESTDFFYFSNRDVRFGTLHRFHSVFHLICYIIQFSWIAEILYVAFHKESWQLMSFATIVTVSG